MYRTLTDVQTKKRHKSQSTVNPNELCVLLNIGKGFLSASAALKVSAGAVSALKIISPSNVTE